MSGFTKGPWKACKDATCPCGAIWDPSGEIHLATAFDETASGMDCFGSEAGVPREERIANARLIASAPDLLEALQANYNRLLVKGMIGDPHDERALEKARAAISKALGEQA